MPLVAHIPLRSAFSVETDGAQTPTALLEVTRSMRQSGLDDFISDDVECPTCGDAFESERGMKVHHKLSHGESIAGVEATCGFCGESFTASSYQIQQSDGAVYCSRQCSQDAQRDRYSVPCSVCGKRVERRRCNINRKNFCSSECKSAGMSGDLSPRWAGREVITCEVCGAEFEVKPSHKDTRICCSRECSKEYKSQNYSGENHPSWEGGPVTVECDLCGEKTQVKRYRLEQYENNFCTAECHVEWMREHAPTGENSAAWKGGLVEVECANCGDSVRRKPHRTQNHDRHFCSNDCKSEWQQIYQSGQQNPRWNGGSGIYAGLSAALGDRSWLSIREDVRGETCEVCGERPSGISLDVHHIIPLRAGGTHAPELLMTLCRSCHMKAEAYTQNIPEVEPVCVEG